jgi:hypothetical protein
MVAKVFFVAQAELANAASIAKPGYAHPPAQANAGYSGANGYRLADNFMPQNDAEADRRQVTTGDKEIPSGKPRTPSL